MMTPFIAEFMGTAILLLLAIVSDIFSNVVQGFSCICVTGCEKVIFLNLYKEEEICIKQN